jgi:hypothetical protein
LIVAFHCTECQRLSGGAFAINALIEADRVEMLAGDPMPVPVTGTSGKPQTIFRCPSCQVALWSQLSRRRGQNLLCPGRNARGAGATAARHPHLYGDAAALLALPENVPAVAEYYPARHIWRAESLERRRRPKNA